MTSLQGLSTAMESPQMSPPAAGDTAHKTQGNSSSSSFSSSIPPPTASRTGGQCPANALQQRLGAGNADGKALWEFPHLFLLNSSLTPQEQPCSGKTPSPIPCFPANSRSKLTVHRQRMVCVLIQFKLTFPANLFQVIGLYFSFI